jgi:hypothetical protein
LKYTDDFFQPYPNTYLDQALQYLGIPYTGYYIDFSGFISALTSGTPWDMVIVANSAAPNSDWMDPVNTYIEHGGKAIVHSYFMNACCPDAPLWATMGIDTFVDDLNPPDPVYWWVPSHPFFSFPMSVPEFTSLTEHWFVYGQHIEPLPGFEALSGYTTPGPDTGEASLILGNDDRTVFKGFIDGQNEADLDSDSILDSVELWINLINGVLFGITGDIPWLSEDPITGVVPAGACTDAPVAITFDSAGLVPGKYLGDLQVNSNDPYIPTITLPVTLTVVIPEIDLYPLSLEMTLLPNTTVTGKFTVINDGLGELNWNLTDGASWLSENPISGTILPGGSKDVIVTFDTTGLAPGIYDTDIVISSNDPDESSVSLPVTLTVKDYRFFLPITIKH